MDADLLVGTLKDGKIDKAKEEKDATVLCIKKDPSGLSFSFPISGSKTRAQITSPPLKDWSGTEDDNTVSVIEPDGHRYALRAKRGSISGCMFDKPGKMFACATISTEQPEARTPNKPKNNKK